jgi:hypothetical protein
VLALCFLLLGCVPGQSQEQPSVGEHIGDDGGDVRDQGLDTHLPVIEIGQEADNTESVELTNAVGQPIMGLTVKHVLDDGHETLLIHSEDGTWAQGQTARVHYTPPVDIPSTESTEPQGSLAFEAALNDLYDIRITFADSTEAVIHELNLLVMMEARIRIADGIAYVEYADPVYGTVSTLEFERAYPTS